MIPIVNSRGHLQGWWLGRVRISNAPDVVKIDVEEQTLAAPTMGGDRVPLTATISFVVFRLVHVKIYGDPVGLTWPSYLVADKIPKKFWQRREAVRMDVNTFLRN